MACPLAAAIAGAGAGAATGGLVGALVGWSIPEERARTYEEGLKNGGILMGVKPRNAKDAEYFHHAWTNGGAHDVYRPGMLLQHRGVGVKTRSLRWCVSRPASAN